MSVRVTFNKTAVRARVHAASEKALPIMTNEFLKDANYYCREETGELIRSSLRASEPEKGIAIWDTDYARKVYYTGRPSIDTNPNASLMWAHKAHTLHKDKYRRIYDKVVKETV